MKIQNKTEIDLSVEDVKVAIGRYLADTHKISFADEVVMRFHVINKPIQHPTYISDTVNKFVFDGVTIIGQNLIHDESDQIFNSHDEAHKYSLTIPWKLALCNTGGESCWCRIILPTEKILYKNQPDGEIVQEFEYIIPDGSIDKETAEYFVELHNREVELQQKSKKRLEALQKLSDLDQELGFQ